MTEKVSFIPARLKNAAVGGYVAGASDIDYSELPVSDGTDVESGGLYIDSTDRSIKVKA